MDANNWFNDNTGTRKTAERQNDFGGTFGGPVYIPHLYNGKDNKTFFFFSYEGLRLVNPQPALTVQVPDNALLTSLASSPMLPLLEQFPVANGPDLGDGVAGSRLVFVATGLEAGPASPEGTEQLQLQWVPFDEVMAMISDGEIVDAMTILAMQQLALERAAEQR